MRRTIGPQGLILGGPAPPRIMSCGPQGPHHPLVAADALPDLRSLVLSGSGLSALGLHALPLLSRAEITFVIGEACVPHVLIAC